MFYVAEGFDVVDDGGALVEAEHRRKIRGLDARVGALAFERFDEAGFLAADVSARAAMDVDFEVEAGAEDVLAKEPVGLGFGDGLLQDFRAEREFATDVEVGQMHIEREGGDDHPFDQLVRILVDDVAVFERAGLGFVGVADEIDRLGLAGADEPPFDAARETRAAASAQGGGFDFVDDVAGSHRDGFFEIVIPAVAQVASDVRRVAFAVDVREDDSLFARVWGAAGGRWHGYLYWERRVGISASVTA